MRRDPRTGDPDLFSFARDYLHAYMPRVRALSPKTIEAYRISLECFLGYLAEAEHTGAHARVEVPRLDVDGSAPAQKRRRVAIRAHRDLRGAQVGDRKVRRRRQYPRRHR